MNYMKLKSLSKKKYYPIYFIAFATIIAIAVLFSISSHTAPIATKIKPKPDSALPIVKNAGELFQTGKFVESETEYKKALTINPNSSSALDGLGNLYRYQGKNNLAESYFKKAIEVDPKNGHHRQAAQGEA